MTTNKILRKPDFDGIKTGITPAAGPCLCTRFRKFDISLNMDVNFVVIVLKCNEKEDRFSDAYNLTYWAYNQVK